jgi:DNA-binding GntR family transcriptional regulator
VGPLIPEHVTDSDDLARIALYVRVSSALRARIALSDWRIGERLPTLDELCAQYQVSRNTMRQAVDVLRSDGLVRSARGKGIVVARSPEPGARGICTGDSHDHQQSVDRRSRCHDQDSRTADCEKPAG